MYLLFIEFGFGATGMPKSKTALMDYQYIYKSVNALKHYNYSALVLWATFSFSKFWTVTTVPSGTVATIATFFFF